jgi:1,4-dihydroxy-2-naphthoate octaprenyltransferase
VPPIAVRGKRVTMQEPSTAVFHRRTVPNRLAAWLAATRPAFLTASVMPVLVGLAFSWHAHGTISFELAVATLLNIVLIHAGANVLNDYYDAQNGTDGANTARVFPFSGGSRFIQNGVLTTRQTFWLGAVLLGSGALLGLAMAAVAGPFVLAIGVVGGLLAIYYSAPPCLACRGLGDFAIAACFGVLPVAGTEFIQAGTVSPGNVWLGTAVGCFVAGILWINSIPDIAADRQAGKLTLPVRLGPARAPYGLLVLFVTGFALIALGPLPAGVLLALLAIVPAAMAMRALLGGQLIPAMPLTLATHASVCILLVAGLLPH